MVVAIRSPRMVSTLLENRAAPEEPFFDFYPEGTNQIKQQGGAQGGERSVNEIEANPCYRNAELISYRGAYTEKRLLQYRFQGLHVSGCV